MQDQKILDTIDSCKIICKNLNSGKMTLFHSIIIYILYIIRKLKSRKNNYYKCTNKLSYLEALLLIRIICCKKFFIY